jgi:NAD(P)-dependent dehydrogenase (short-subunit alcohol dehydrogenase family)
MMKNAARQEEGGMEDSLFDLSGKVAVVSGAGRGIGKAIALALAGAGADLVVFSRTEEQFTATAQEIEAMGCGALCMRVDVSRPEDIDAVVSATLDTYGHLDIMVNNAGFNPSYTRMEREKEEDFDRIMDINVKGAWHCNQRVVPVMKEQGKGCIINVASIGGLGSLYKCNAYTASKGALVQMTRTMALELAPFNIRVNALCPGYVGTEMTELLLEHPKEGQRILDHIPMGRTGEPEEIAGPAVFMASDAASYMTGATLVVDGGWMVA